MELFLFLDEVTAAKRLKIDANNCFWNNCFGPKKDKKFLNFCEKSMHGTFLIFGIKLQEFKGLKLTQMIFLGNTLHWKFLGQKMAQNKFFKFYDESCIEFL